MKRLIALSLFCFWMIGLKSQSTTNVYWEINDDWVFIHYKIPEATDRFIFDVSVWCSVDGGKRFQINKAGGDVGAKIRGGKPRYKVTWESRKALKNPKFYVEANLVKIESVRKVDGKYYIGYNGSFGLEKQSAGFRAGYFRNVGGYGAFSIDPDDSDVGTVTGGVTYGFFQKYWGALYGYSGIGIGDFFDEATIETGVIFSARGFCLAFGSNLEFGVFETNIVLGFGFMF